MSRRDPDGKFVRQHSVKYLAFLWVSTVLSFCLLYVSGNAVTDSFAAFQSCSSNSTVLSVHNCGKQGLNTGDIVLIALFAASAALAVSMFTLSWRKTRGRE